MVNSEKKEKKSDERIGIQHHYQRSSKSAEVPSSARNNNKARYKRVAYRTSRLTRGSLRFMFKRFIRERYNKIQFVKLFCTGDLVGMLQKQQQYYYK
jgi:hypothetical protein